MGTSIIDSKIDMDIAWNVQSLKHIFICGKTDRWNPHKKPSPLIKILQYQIYSYSTNLSMVSKFVGIGNL